ncbi:MAG: hypothetical protein DRG69_09120 [Deltaproteobacteria bacterium]|nr:MAG: hypothetical protein DRG69_09120 [Deltaproteobacteria bacterium]
MNEKFQKKTMRIVFLIIFVSFACIILFSFIPLIYESIPESSPDFDKFADIYIKKHAEQGENITMNLYQSIHSMRIRDNDNVQELAGKAQVIGILFWVILLVGLLTFMGLLFNTAGMYHKISFILLVIGCAMVVLCFLTLYYEYIFADSVNSFDNIALASIGSTSSFVKYFYFIVLLSIILTFGSLLYLKNFMVYVRKHA